MRRLVQGAFVLAVVVTVVAFAANRLHHSVVVLTCEWRYDGVDASATFNIDYTNSIVDGFPADITDDVIAWRPGYSKEDLGSAKTYRSIDRHLWSLYGVSSPPDSTAQAQAIHGTCKPDDRKF